MRKKAMLTIGNQYTSKVKYQIFKPEDEGFLGGWVPYKEMAGWIDSKKSVEVELDLATAKIGFRNDKGEWLAKPTKITNNRSVTLTRDKKITQPSKPEFTDPLHVNDVNFWNDGSTENLLRTGVLKILSFIPKAGGLISGLVGQIWPEKKVDLIAQSEARMERWFRGRINDFHRQLLAQDLSGLRNVLHEYSEATAPAQREQWLNNSLAIFAAAQPRFIEGKYTPGTLALACDVATLHLGILRERVVFRQEIFGDQAVNHDHHVKALKEAIDTYQKYVRNVAVPGELAWREQQLEFLWPYSTQLMIKDWVTREVHVFQNFGGTTNPGPVSVLGEYYKAMVLSSLRLELQQHALDPAATWILFDPERENELPIALDRVIWAGPMAGLPFQGGHAHNFKFNDVHVEPRGKIQQVLVREHNAIDGLQFNFAGRKSKLIGNSQGGSPHTFKLNDGVFIKRVSTRWDWQLHGLKLDFSDGSSTGKLGNRNNSARFDQVLAFKDHYVSAVKVGNRLHELHLGFSPRPDFYQRARS